MANPLASNPRSGRGIRRSLLLITAALAFLASACLPTPPGTYRTDQFPAGWGPNLYRGLVFKGFGTWVDVFDWSPTMTGGNPPINLTQIDFMAAAGVQTLYIQTATFRRPETVLDQPQLSALIQRAHERNMKVVGWYLPQHLDVNLDIARLAAIPGLGVDGVGFNIESRDNPDVGARNAALLQTVHAMRAAFPDMPMSIIPVTPVVLDVINPNYWPNFPYADLVNYFDVWMPMAYWTNRTPQSGYRDAYRYVSESVTRTRADTGVAWLPVHPIGGIGDGTTLGDIGGMNNAINDTTSIGGSIYDANTTQSWMWAWLVAFRR